MTTSTDGLIRRCAMLVANDVSSDSRVQKSAQSISDLGIDVTIFGIQSGTRAPNDTHSGYRIVRLGNPAVLLNRQTSKLQIRLSRWERFLNVPLSGVKLLIGYDPRDSRHASRRRKSKRFNQFDRRYIHFKEGSKRTGLNTGTAFAHLVKAKSASSAGYASAGLERLALVYSRQVKALLRRLEANHEAKRALAALRDYQLVFVDAVIDYRPDIVWAHDYHSMSSATVAAAVLAEKGFEAKLIYDAHEFVAGIANLSPPTIKALQRYEADHIGGFDNIVTVSEPLAALLEERYEVEGVLVNHNSPSMHDNKPSNIALRVPGPVSEINPIVVYSGNIAPQRGIADLIGALNLLPEWQLVVVSPESKAAARQPIEILARELGVINRVHFAPYVDREMIADYLSTATVGASCLVSGPINHEVALPNKLFEYLRAGLPVVVSARRAQANFVQRYGVGNIYESGNTQQLANALLQSAELRQDDDFHIRLQQVNIKYSWESNAPNFERLCS